MKDIELPPLPEPDHFAFIDGGNGIYVEGGPTGEPFYSAEQMRDYSRAAVEADRAQRVPDGWVLIATDAYEAGFGKGEQAHKNGKDVENPWGDEPGREAWAMGYALGKERAASTPAPAQQETSEGCDPHWSYYFRVTECKAKTSRDGDCICWHTEGTGPFDMVRHDDADQFLEWRESPSSAPAPAQQEPSEAEMVCAEAYQVVGCLLSDLGLFETEAARKILDNLSEARRVHQDVLPWESAAKHQEPPQQERKRLTGEQASAMAAYFNVPADYVHTVYNRVHGIKE